MEGANKVISKPILPTGSTGAPPLGETIATTQHAEEFNFAEVLGGAFQAGGIFMYPLAALMVIGSIVIIERLYMILFVYKANAASLMQRVQRLVLDNNIEEAVKLCNRKKKAAVYQVFKAALVNADRPFEEIREHVEVANMAVIPKLQSRVPYLFTIGNVATLLGLLGTVVGLVMTFKFVNHDVVEASDKQKLLTIGISTALNCTAFGLIVAIPCMLVYGFLFNKINTIVDELDHYSGKLLLLLRTGGQYFDHFNSESAVSTQQTPQKKAANAENPFPNTSAATTPTAATTPSANGVVPSRPAEEAQPDERTRFMERPTGNGDGENGDGSEDAA
ncbi:MAG: MotA/TolQ/ExbB proton channel family protein [Bacteriovoracia bacterium]